MRRAAWAAWVGLIAGQIGGAEPVAVVPVVAKPTLDGILVEWGAPERIGLVPGGERVGVRGAFAGADDHEADLYLLWDADYLYVAAAVVDDTVDAQQIPPSQREWRGPSGERKDAMFYYDHLKIFLRGPEQPLGHTIWLSPANGAPYLWGGMQRAEPTTSVPVRAGGTRRDALYTFEVGIPWQWLGLYPEPDMVFDALFLLPDSDQPDEDLRDKVRQSNKWIWWQGEVQLEGRPSGWRQRPKVQVIAEIAEQTRAITVPKVAVRKDSVAAEVAVRKQQDSVAVEVAARKQRDPVAVEEIPAATDATDTVKTASRPQTASLGARLERSLSAKTYRAPDWVRALSDENASPGQVDSLYYRLTHSLVRLSAGRINIRTDGLVMDLAEYAGTWRAPAQHFLQKLLTKTLADLAQQRLHPQIAGPAAEVGVDSVKAIRFVQSLCRAALEIYAEGHIASSSTLIDNSRRRAKLSAEQAHELLAALAVAIPR